MVPNIIPDLLRGSTTTISLLLLLPILSKGKIKPKLYLFLIVFITILDLAICTVFYMERNYTAVLYYSLVMYIAIIIGLKFLLKDQLFQWLFNSVTVLNIYAMIVLSSYFLSDIFPYQEYANTIIRLLLFTGVILIFKKLIRPLYLDVSENWAAFLLPTVGILVSYLYILLSIEDVEESMNQNLIHFYLLTIITIFTYSAIIVSLKSLRGQYLLREENLKRKAVEELLRSEIHAYESTLTAAKHTRHDIRHHNAILIEYLQLGDIEGAKHYLELYDDNLKDTTLREYSKNPAANAVFRIYERRAKEHYIEFAVHSQADSILSDRLPDIGIVLSNLFENALEACKKYRYENKYITFSSKIENDSILIEIRNSVQSIVRFENGLPVTTKRGGGAGLLSVKNIIEKYHGMMECKQNASEFYTRIILPIVKKE